MPPPLPPPLPPSTARSRRAREDRNPTFALLVFLQTSPLPPIRAAIAHWPCPSTGRNTMRADRLLLGLIGLALVACARAQFTGECSQASSVGCSGVRRRRRHAGGTRRTAATAVHMGVWKLHAHCAGRLP